MKKVIGILLIFAVLLSAVNFSFAEENTEIIYANSFEDGFSDWEYQGKYSPEYATLSDKGATDKEKSVHIMDIADNYNIGIISPYFNITPGETYTASVDLFVVSGTVKMFFKYYDENGKQILNKSVSGKEGIWKNLVSTHQAPKNAVTCRIYLCTDSSTFGEGYYDNFIFLKGEKASQEIKDAKIPEKKIVADEEYDVTKEAKLLFADSFEEDLKNWTYYNKASEGKVKIISDATDGVKAVSITDESDQVTAGLRSPFIAVTQGVKYTATMHLKHVSGNSTNLYFKYFDKDKKQIASQSKTHLYNYWQSVYITYEAPEGAEFCQIQLVGTIAKVGEAYVDNVAVYEGVVVPTTFGAQYIPPVQNKAIKSKIVEPVNGKLKYNTYNDMGDTLGDYSYAGFYSGNYELPETKKLPIIETLSPSGTKEDTDRIQAAIDRAERNDGGINVVKLKAGKYYIGTKGLKLKSGVLLSGEGQGPDGTNLYAYDNKQYRVLNIAGAAPFELVTRATIIDNYVKSGSRKINIPLEDAQWFHPGDDITIVHNSTEEWAKAIKMVGTINVYDDITTWLPNTVNMLAERTITAVNGTEITLDFPVFVPYMKELVPSYIVKTKDVARIENAGVENLRFESYYNGDKKDEVHATTAIQVSQAKNIFVRDVTAKYFYFGLITVGKGAKQITALNCSCLEPVSRVEGGRRYSFCASTGSQQFLCTGCYSYDSRHDYATSGQAGGPIVYVDNVVEMSNTSSESHGVWTNGLLYDNVYHIGNSARSFTALANRGIYGTVYSQGWTSAGSVIWNSLSSTTLVHKPPLSYQNFAVGVWGVYTDSQAMAMKDKNITSFKRIYRTGESIEHTEENFATDENTSITGDAYKEALYNPVEPRSLYKAQLAERFTGNIENERPNAPVLISPFPDSSVMNSLSVTGISQLGASKVTVYVDNIPYDAKINEDNTFEATVELSDGTHKVYATQTIKGYESNKTADRFVIVNKPNGNPDYLQSIYEPEKTRMIVNDTRPTFDKIINGVKVKINKKLLYSDVLPYETNGRVLVPMRAIFEKLNASVSWDDKTATATAVKDGITVKITENSTKAYVNGNEVILDVPATIINGRFVVPVRFISESFGAKVGWIDETKTVTIEY